MSNCLHSSSFSRRACNALGAGIFTLLLGACGQSDRNSKIDAWMRCDECTGQERQQVAALAGSAVRTLAVHLRSPSTRRLETARRQFAESYQPVSALTQEAYVALMMESYVARYQTRAAASLGDINTTASRRELERALAQAEPRGYRPDVVRAIGVALARLTHVSFTGTLSAAEVDFGDTVRVRAGSEVWNGAEAVELVGSPFGKELFVRRFDPPQNDDSLAFVAVGDLGTYAVSVKGLGASGNDQSDATLQIRSLGYTVHTPATADVMTEAMLPLTRYLVLGARGGDSLDYIKVAPVAGAVTVTATTRATGFGAMHMGWRSCSAAGFPGGSTVAGTVALGSGVPIGGARVQVEGTLIAAVTPPGGAFALASIPPAAVTGGFVTLRITRIGYALRVVRLPVGTTGNVVGLIPQTATAATAMLHTSSVVTVGNGDCQLLQIWSPPGRHRIVQLKIAQ